MTATTNIGRKKRTASAASTEAERTGLRAQGQRTRNAIVRVARKLLLEGGSLEFTLREVAARAKISISNLQYYFPSRIALLRAVAAPVIEDYLEDLQRAVDSRALPFDTLKLLVERGVRDSKDPEKSALWWHFMSLAAIDDECSYLLDQWYEQLTRAFGQLIHEAHPEADPKDCQHQAIMLIAMADGLSFQCGAGRRKRDYMEGFEEKFFAAADSILRGQLLPKRKK